MLYAILFSLLVLFGCGPSKQDIRDQQYVEQFQQSDRTNVQAILDHIYAKKINLGMSFAEVQKIAGTPKVNIQQFTKKGTLTEAVFSGENGDGYLIFLDGRLINVAYKRDGQLKLVK